MTDRLYYTDPYDREFDATVLGVETAGGRRLVQLDRTAFYPTSGGQPYDIGTLGEAHVVDVVDENDGRISHVVDTADTPQIGARVHGVIDWARRFDHMQQHTGQHLLSAAFDRLFGVRTVSFHLGVDRSHDRSGAGDDPGRDGGRGNRGESDRLGGPAGRHPICDG